MDQPPPAHRFGVDLLWSFGGPPEEGGQQGQFGPEHPGPPAQDTGGDHGQFRPERPGPPEEGGEQGQFRP